MKSEILEICFILLICILSFFVMKYDIKHKKIKNKLILNGFFLGSVLFLFGFYFGVVEVRYLQEVALNLVVAFGVAYVFWLASFWPAGDAKLFVLFSFLLPLHYYWKSYLPVFPSLVLLINIFVCAYIFLLVRAFFYIGRVLTKWNFFLSEIINKIKRFISLDNIYFFLKKINIINIGKSFIMVLVMFFFLYHSFDLNKISVYTLMKTSAVSLVLWMMFSWVVKKHIAESELYVISIEKLREGDLPVKMSRDIFTDEFLKKVGIIRADGLGVAQVSMIFDMLKMKGIKEIVLQKTMPFSPWIIIGVVVTFFLSDSVLQVIGKNWR